MVRLRTLLPMLLCLACAPDGAPDADATLNCGDAPAETPIQECIRQNLALRDRTVRITIDTLLGRGVPREQLDAIDRTWRARTLAQCGPRPDSTPPARAAARALWSCYSGAFNEHMAVLRDLRPR